MSPKILTVALCGCAAAPLPVRLGYHDFGEPQYEVHASEVSPSGIHFDPTGQHVSGALLDKLTAEVEACAGTISRAAFVVKVPSDWSLSCDGSQQILRSRAPEAGCAAKGQLPDPKCPCRWRAVVQSPNVIVATPNLLLFKDALTRLVTGSSNPWADPKLASCVAPTKEPQ